MTNVINFRDYKRSPKPKKRMIDADILLETLAEYIYRETTSKEDRKIMLGLHLFIDKYADMQD